MVLLSFLQHILVLFLLSVSVSESFVAPSARHGSSRGLAPSTRRYFFNFGPKPEEKEDPVEEERNEPEEEKDLIEKTFEFFFGKPEAEPLGLKRFGRERFPEQYPATVDEWAEPLEGDSPEVARLRPLLRNTNVEFRGLKLTYDANKNGWNAAKFHQCVDRLGGALVVCTTQNGQVCGGYNPKGWVGYGEARGSIAAFLFARNSDGSYTKLRKVGGAGLAQLDNPENGPSFGADSLVIPLGKEKPRMARSKLGSYYERFADGTNSLFGKGKSSVQLKDLKVYHGVYEEGEYIPFTDAEPFALYWVGIDQEKTNRRGFFASVMTALGTTVVGSLRPQPAQAIGPVKIDLKPTSYKAAPCPPDKPIPGEKAMFGMRGLCVTVQADLGENSPKDLDKVGVYGFVVDGDTGNSVLANNPDLSTDAGQFAMIESITTKDKKVEFEFIAAVPTSKDLSQYENGIGPLEFDSLRVISFPGGQQFGAISPCEMNEFSDECEAWEAENGPYKKGDYMMKSNPRTKGR